MVPDEITSARRKDRTLILITIPITYGTTRFVVVFTCWSSLPPLPCAAGSEDCWWVAGRAGAVSGLRSRRETVNKLCSHSTARGFRPLDTRPQDTQDVMASIVPDGKGPGDVVLECCLEGVEVTSS